MAMEVSLPVPYIEYNVWKREKDKWRLLDDAMDVPGR